jgi:hypothetical protein
MEQESAIQRVPPYVAYRSFRTLIEDIRTQGFPSHVDKDVTKRFSGSVRAQLMTALRFLKLVNDANEPTPLLRDLVDAEQPDQWKSALKVVLDGAYGPFMELNLAQSTPTALTKEFRERYKAKDDVTEKIVRFFVQAAKDAGVELSKRITDVTRTRSPRSAGKETKKPDAPDMGDISINVVEKESQQRPRGSEKTVHLKSGAGSVTLLLDVNLMDLESGEEEAFIMGLRNLVKAYEKSLTVSTEETSKVEEEAGE